MNIDADKDLTGLNVLWEVPYINGKQIIQTEKGIFHFELVLRGISDISRQNKHKWYSHSQVKIYPLKLNYSGKEFSFVQNFIERTSICAEYPSVRFNWKEAYAKRYVLDPVELTPQEQFERHKVMIESFIDNEYYDEISKLFKSKLD